MSFDAWEMELHGHHVVYRVTGSGPPVVLIHGMVNSSRHWRAVAERLGERHTVIAPDLVGHGDSATPRGDYSLGAHATVIRDLLSALGIERATFVGHSLGGGIAMVYFWQFPQQVERLALVSSGGLGPEVSPLLRSAALPGFRSLIGLFANPVVLGALGAGGVQGRTIARALRPLGTRGAREAFVQTLRAVIDVHGQRVSAMDRLYLLERTPFLVAWGDKDRTIPVEHGIAAHEAVPGSRFATIPGAAHFPHIERPEALAQALQEFIDGTVPAVHDDDSWRDVLRRRTPEHPRPRAVA
jgi:pimeloyl-ACP methyl ester carboxylesterase